MPMFSLKRFQDAAHGKPSCYLATVLSRASIAGDNLIFTEEDYLFLIEKYSPSELAKAKGMLSDSIHPVAREDWPLWVKAVALLSSEEDKGIGDTIARKIGPIGGDDFKEWYKKTTGKDCGCSARQTDWNTLYPLT